MSHTRCTTRPPVHPPTTEVLLNAVLDGVADAVDTGSLAGPALLALRRPGPGPCGRAEPELLSLPLPEGTHPADGLAGHTAPADWFAVGCVAAGTARSLDDGRALQRATFSFLLHADGTSIADLPGQARLVGHEGGTNAPEGLVADTCRRVLGLPTAPPTDRVSDWTGRRWLDRVFADIVADPGAAWTWERVADRHPPEAEVELEEHSWSELRLACARLGPEQGLIDPELAAWMDDGMFSRHVIECLPAPATLLAELQPLIPADLHDRLTYAFA